MNTLLVVGASSDLGSALIGRVASSYGTVWAHYRKWNDNLEALRAAFGEKVRFVQADLLDPESMEAMIAEIRSSGCEPDHIVHFPMTRIVTERFTKTDWESFDVGWDLSVRSAVVILQAFLPRMKKNKAGKVLFLLTSNTLDTPPKCQSAYTTVKYAMLGLMKSLAAEYADKGISINGVSPDMIRTKFLSELPELLVEQYAQTRPEKRILSVEDVVPVLARLLSDEAEGITGENIPIR